MAHLLYHYSTQLYSVLKTLRKQGRKGENDNQKEHGHQYIDHISFFIEPIPLDILPSIHRQKHPFYKEGKKLYEYVVPTDKLGMLFYELVESPEKTSLLYDKTISDDIYHIRLSEAMLLNHYEGHSISDINKLIDRFKGTTREAFKKIPTRPNYKEIMTKYAPTVPHFMIYPDSGEIAFSEVNIVTLGKKHITTPVMESSIITKW